MSEAEHQRRIATSVQGYSQGTLSQGRAAEIAGLTRAEFLAELGRRQVAAIQVTPEELEAELEHFRAARG